MELRQYQIDLARTAYEKLTKLGIVYLALEMRVGKTLIALLAAYFLKARRVLFITKKKAISSIVSDYESFEFGFELTVTNYEQVEKAGTAFDVVVIDEAHSLGAFPKPALRTKAVRDIVGDKPLILLSGTPSPESYSQLFHQFWVSTRSPFAEYKNFYRWADDFVKVKQMMINGLRINNYKEADRKKIAAAAAEYFLTYTQADAGFAQAIVENIRTVPIQARTKILIGQLLADGLIQLPNGAMVVADTPVKLQSKVHQLSSGTVIDEEGRAHELDRSKAEFIRSEYQGKKIAIFYKYTAEGELLKRMFNCTERPELFAAAENDLVFISQVRSGAMGVNLAAADVIIMYNIDFSSVLYWQARARMQSRERERESVVDWLFSDRGIEEKIYDAVIKKKDYTTTYFQRDYGKAHSKKDRGLSEKSGSLCRQGLACGAIGSA